MKERTKVEIDQQLGNLSERYGRPVYGIIWAGARPYFVEGDEGADLGIEA